MAALQLTLPEQNRGSTGKPMSLSRQGVTSCPHHDTCLLQPETINAPGTRGRTGSLQWERLSQEASSPWVLLVALTSPVLPGHQATHGPTASGILGEG